MRLSTRQIQVDAHTHTIISGHAWSTLEENCRAGAAIGLQMLCLTEHGPAMEGSMPWFAPYSYRMLPNTLFGVQIVPGVEFNILDMDGTLDIVNADALEGVRFGIASMHDVTTPLVDRNAHTQAYIAALHNPHVDILGHPGYAYFEQDPHAIVLAAKALSKLIEINNNSFSSRPGSMENCILYAKYCKQYGVRVCVSSDAHFHTMVGRVPAALSMLEELDFPPELVLNFNAESFRGYLLEREKRFCDRE